MKISKNDKILFDLTLKSLIGNNIKIIQHSNQNLIGQVGLIVNETQSFFEILQENNIKKILKNSLVFEVKIQETLQTSLEVSYGLGIISKKNSLKTYKIDSEILKNSLSQRIKKFK